MTLLSLFMTSTGIFCFVPISQRLVESGIIPTSDSWRFQRLPSVLAPTLHAHGKEKFQSLLAADKVGDAWSEAAERHRRQPPHSQNLLYAADDAVATDQQPTVSSTNSEWNAGTIPSRECSPWQSTPFSTFYGHESTSFISVTQDSTLCDSCNTLLQREIPPDHIPSVIRALALFEAQDRLSDAVFDECEVVALTSAFSMLRL